VLQHLSCDSAQQWEFSSRLEKSFTLSLSLSLSSNLAHVVSSSLTVHGLHVFKLETADPSKTSAYIYQTARHISTKPHGITSRFMAMFIRGVFH
jgi:hypothetical protein